MNITKSEKCVSTICFISILLVIGSYIASLIFDFLHGRIIVNVVDIIRYIAWILLAWSVIKNKLNIATAIGAITYCVIVYGEIFSELNFLHDSKWEGKTIFSIMLIIQLFSVFLFTLMIVMDLGAVSPHPFILAKIWYLPGILIVVCALVMMLGKFSIMIDSYDFPYEYYPLTYFIDIGLEGIAIFFSGMWVKVSSNRARFLKELDQDMEKCSRGDLLQ